MKYIDLYNIRAGIEKAKNLTNEATIDFCMTLARIDAEVTNELKIIEKGKRKYPEKYTKDYIKERQTIESKFIVQKADGTIQTLNGNPLIKDIKKYNEEIAKLDEKYNDEVKEVEKINKEFEDYLETPCVTPITKIAKTIFPSTTTVEVCKLLYSVINYDK